MAVIDYPSTLPAPSLTSQPKVRARNAGLPGSHTATAPERDYYGTLDVSFFFTRDQATTFKNWWDSNQGYWFNAAWPRLSQSLSVYRLLGAPTFNHVMDGAYRVSAKVELRGASLAVQAPLSDPFFAQVLSLLHFEDAPGTSIPVDTVPGVVWQNSDATKAIVSVADPLFGASSLARQTTGAGGLYTTYFSTLPGPFTVEFFIKFTSFPFNQRRIFAVSGSGGYAGALVVNANVGFFGVDGAVDLASTVPAVAGTRYHVAVTFSGTTAYLWIDGALALSFAWTSALSGAFSMSPGHARSFNGDFVHHYLDEFRFTSGVARYIAPFSAPTAAFPNR